MLPAVERRLAEADKEQLTAALLSACQELAENMGGWDMNYKGKMVSAGSLNNQVLKHLTEPETIFEEEEE